MIGPVSVVVMATSAVRTRIPPVLTGLVALAVVAAPLQAAAVGALVAALSRFRRGAARSRELRDRDDAALEAAELVALGLSGGQSVGAAHRLAASHSRASIRPALEELVESMELRGVTNALAGDAGPTHEASDVLRGAASSGAPALPALEAHIRQAHHRRHMEAVERTRRLPIRLLLPLTLIVLPGFVLITVGPTIVDSLARLDL